MVAGVFAEQKEQPCPEPQSAGCASASHDSIESSVGAGGDVVKPGRPFAPRRGDGAVTGRSVSGFGRGAHMQPAWVEVAANDAGEGCA